MLRTTSCYKFSVKSRRRQKVKNYALFASKKEPSYLKAKTIARPARSKKKLRLWTVREQQVYMFDLAFTWSLQGRCLKGEYMPTSPRFTE